ncbi:DUF881 domain-containing protein [Georgenia sp. Z1344]|uniref:DUF881 domain-containing protein n=1 Tax=Georgenia sp. Z1344 TaxID=3416706 RepID=UPI003CF6A43F
MAKGNEGRRQEPRPRSWESPLRALIDHPLDAGYAAASERREREGTGRPPALRAATWGTVLALGVGLVVAGRELAVPEEGRDPVRAELAAQIQGAEEAADALARGNEELASEVELLREDVVADAPSELGEAARAALDGSAQYALEGPALQIVLSDSEDSASGVPGADDGRVRDTDIQAVVNGLWAAGAEGVGVDGRRLASTTAVRAAGRAILVNLEATSSPYEIVALGDPGELREALDAGTAGSHLNELADRYDIGVSYAELESATLPAVAPRSTSFAVPIGAADITSDEGDR